MEKKVNKYGYIVGALNVHHNEIIFPIEKYNSKGEIEHFVGIDTFRDMSSEEVVMFSSKKDFILWRDEFLKEENQEI